MIAPDAGDAALTNVLDALPEKFIVDFANGIDVVRDHVAVQRSRSGTFDRMWDAFNGKAQRRQTEINASLADGVAGALEWLTDLTRRQAHSNLALTKVKERVAMLQRALADVAVHSGDTRDRLDRLKCDLDRRTVEFTRELQRIDLVQRADAHLNLVFSRWVSGKFAHLPPAGRCYAALEELRWGAFGDFCRNGAPAQRGIYLELLRNRAVSQLAADVRVGASTRLDTAQWLRADVPVPELMDDLAYLGDWADPERAPFVFVAARPVGQMPLLLPRRCDAERMSQALVAEVFEGEAP